MGHGNLERQAILKVVWKFKEIGPTSGKKNASSFL